MIASYSCYLDRSSFFVKVRTALIPLLPSELAAALMACGVAFLYVQVGIAGVALFGVVLVTFQYLLGALLVSQQRAEELELRSKQLASFQVGMLSAMLRTLDLRDQMTARHSAAVARYSRAIAQRAGFSRREEELVHIAALLHDIGKFILPDRILKANVPLTDEDWMLIRRHPQQGARVVSSLDGYGPVAEIILAHHERIDGKGYPRGLAGDDIPELSRIISVADTYDVMTARDSYRTPMSSHDAIVELRRVAGKQLDARFVEVFIELLEGKDVSFAHGEAADFEKELALESRIAETASPDGETQPLPGRRRQRLDGRWQGVGWASPARTAGGLASPPDPSRRPVYGAVHARRHLSGPGAGPDRGEARSRDRRRRRCGCPGRGERDLRVGSAHLPRAGAGRAGVHDRARVRRHGAGARRRRRPGRRSATGCSAASTPPARPAPPVCAATTTAAARGRPSATAPTSATCRGPRPSSCWCRAPT